MLKRFSAVTFFILLCWPLLLPTSYLKQQLLHPRSCFQEKEGDFLDMLQEFTLSLQRVADSRNNVDLIQPCNEGLRVFLANKKETPKSFFSTFFNRLESTLRDIDEAPTQKFLQLTLNDWFLFHFLLQTLHELKIEKKNLTDQLFSVTASVQTLVENIYQKTFLSGELFKDERAPLGPLPTYLFSLSLNVETNSNSIIWAYLYYIVAARKKDPTMDVIPLSKKITFKHLEQFLLSSKNICSEKLSYSQLEFLFITLIRCNREQLGAQKNMRKTIFDTLLCQWKKIPALKSTHLDEELKIRQLCTVLLLHLSFEDVIESAWHHFESSTPLSNRADFLWSTKEKPYSKRIPVAVYLREANLEGSDLTEIDPSFLGAPANLEHANLQNTILDRANFQNANLRQANLKGAKLEATIFDDTLLNEADFSNSISYRVSFFGANLEKAILSNAKGLDTAAVGKGFNGKTKISAQNARFFSEEQLRETEIVETTVALSL